MGGMGEGSERWHVIVYKQIAHHIQTLAIDLNQMHITNFNSSLFPPEIISSIGPFQTLCMNEISTREW